MKDTYGREINYLRLSVTDLCNLRCQYCMPEEGIPKKAHNEMLRFEEMTRIVQACVDLGINKVRLTGGEPLIRRDIVDLVKFIGSVEGVKDLTMTTNGTLLKSLAKPLKEAGLNRINISVDTFNPEKYKTMTRGGNVNDVIESMKVAIEVGLYPIRLNVVLIEGFNDDEIESIVALTKDQEIDIRFIELMPIGDLEHKTPLGYLSNKTVLDRVPELESDHTEDQISVAEYYRLPGGKGRIGLINPMSHKFCDRCNKIRITADGKLKPCLHTDEEIDLKSRAHDLDALREAIKQGILEKNETHLLEEACYTQRDMNRIGG